MHTNHRKFTVIIPTLNEEANVGDRIDEIRAFCPDAEVIVADGGSLDRTQEIARRKGVTVVVSPRGRGVQCNAGAKIANGEIYLFLHADTKLPNNAFAVLERAFQDENTRIGTFRLRLDVDHPLFHFFSACNYFDCVFTRYADQCITMRKSFFEKLGGFPELQYFEDVELLQKARKSTGIRLFPATVVTSGRRFKEQGVIRQYFFDAWLMIQYFLGASPKRLAEKYANFKKSEAKGKV
jgi:rSAM/selenodomain-associated transferase 2